MHVSCIQEVIDTNFLGSMLGSRAAARIMAAQSSGGKIILISGAGATGGPTANSAAYGASKRALTQLKARTRSNIEFWIPVITTPCQRRQYKQFKEPTGQPLGVCRMAEGSQKGL